MQHILDTLSSYMTAHGVPPLVQPILLAFVFTLPNWIVLTRWEQRATGGQGASFNPKTWQVTVFFCGLIYIRDYTEIGHFILTWPDLHVPYWHEHWWQIIIGGIVAGLIAKQIAKALRHAQSSQGVRRSRTLSLQIMPGEKGWFSHSTFANVGRTKP